MIYLLLIAGLFLIIAALLIAKVGGDYDKDLEQDVEKSKQYLEKRDENKRG